MITPLYATLYPMNPTNPGQPTSMDPNSTQEDRTRAESVATRIAALGIPKGELAQRAGIDRGTLGRLLKADPRVTNRTWTVVERVLGQLEAEVGIDVRLGQSMTASGETVESVVEYQGARITLSGKADAVAEAIRRVLDPDGE